MPKARRTKNFNVDEQLRLLSIVAQRLPHRQSDWDQIADEFKASSTEYEKPRSGVSLKRKFLSLSQSSRACRRGDCSSIQLLAFNIKRKLADDAMNRVENPSNRCDHSNNQPRYLELSDRVLSEENESDNADAEIPGLLLVHEPPIAAQLPAEPNRTPGSRVTSLRGSDRTLGSRQLPLRIPLSDTAPTQGDTIQLFLWCLQQDQQRSVREQRNDRSPSSESEIRQRERAQDIRAANERHTELLACIASLKQ